MNIESQKVNQTNKVEVVKTSQVQSENTSNFADELKELGKEKKVAETQKCESENIEKSTNSDETKDTSELSEKEIGLQNLEPQISVHNDSKQIYSTAIEGLNTVVKELNQPEELKSQQDLNNQSILKMEQSKEPDISNNLLNTDKKMVSDNTFITSEKAVIQKAVKPEEEPNLKTNLESNIESNPEPNLEQVSAKVKYDVKQKSELIETVNQSEEKVLDKVQNYVDNADNVNMNVNDINTNENPELLAQMSPNMNFSNNQQSFSSLMEQNAKSQKTANILGNNSAELAEEANILSTMAENIAMANRTLIKEDGIVKVDAKTGIKIENIVKFDSIIMNQADVEVFSSLVNNTELNLNELTSESVQKSVQISKTLADMLAKAKETNQPLRIDFDNNISVIIKISRDGKISADFLPSSQVAEAYLKENLPLLRQKFDENGIKYDDLNQRERKNQEERNNNRKKGRNDE
ncbi:MAG: hypothetical protein E7Z89_06855 [Cyanobacteria bacterium SIG28]|nr:hypothetical protein [Cyanobacteria bacterium SIG28]